MSAKNKLKISVELLKELLQIIQVEQKQLKQKLQCDIQNLTKFIEEVPLVDDNNYDTQQMSLMILNQTIEASLKKLNEYYQCQKKEQQFFQSQLLENIKDTNLDKQSLQKDMIELLFDDVNKDLIRQMNFNVFLRQNNIKLKEDKGGLGVKKRMRYRKGRVSVEGCIRVMGFKI